MATDTLTARRVHVPRQLRAYGLITILAALIGSSCAVAIIAWPEQVP